MKRAVVVVGKHYAGKSKTIRKYVTAKLGIGKDDHKFTYKDQDGYILSQTFEEADRDIATALAKYSKYDLLILAARPAGQNPSCLNELVEALTNAGYAVGIVEIAKAPNEDYYDGKAEEVISQLNKTGIAKAAGGA